MPKSGTCDTEPYCPIARAPFLQSGTQYSLSSVMSLFPRRFLAFIDALVPEPNGREGGGWRKEEGREETRAKRGNHIVYDILVLHN